MRLDLIEPVSGATALGTSPIWVQYLAEGNLVLQMILYAIALATAILVFIREVRRHRREAAAAKLEASQ